MTPNLFVLTGLALVLIGVGAAFQDGFRAMVEFTAPVFWLFFLLTGLSLFVLRRREPDRARPFRVPLYPLLPALFCAACAGMLWSSLSYVSAQRLGGLNAAWIGVAVLAAGVLVLALLLALQRAGLRSALSRPEALAEFPTESPTETQAKEHRP